MSSWPNRYFVCILRVVVLLFESMNGLNDYYACYFTKRDKLFAWFGMDVVYLGDQSSTKPKGATPVCVLFTTLTRL